MYRRKERNRDDEMIDDKSQKVVCIKCNAQTHVWWSITDTTVDADDDWLYDKCWLCPWDYEVYTTIQIADKFFKKKKGEKKLKMTKDFLHTLQEKGFVEIVGKSDNWGFDWVIEQVGLWDLKKFFKKQAGIEKRKYFYELIEQLCLYEEVCVIWGWLEIDIARKWCEKNSINYKLDISIKYSDEAKDKCLKEFLNRVRKRSSENRFTEPFAMWNRENLDRKLQ